MPNSTASGWPVRQFRNKIRRGRDFGDPQKFIVVREPFRRAEYGGMQYANAIANDAANIFCTCGPDGPIYGGLMSCSPRFNGSVPHRVEHVWNGVR